MSQHISPTAVVHDAARLDDDVIVWDHAVVEEARIGPHVTVGSHVFVGRYTEIGEGSRIQHGAFITRQTQIGQRVFIGPNVTFTDDKYPRVNNPHYRPNPPVVEDDVSIGGGAVILAGVRLGQGCTVGAGAVVTHDVAPYTTVVGSPARILQKETNL